MKIATIVGTRPNFIKEAVISKELKKANIEEYLIHTGQHYDYEMSKVFFKELNIPEPNINLNVNYKSHATQTAYMMMGIERALIEEKPVCVIVFGDCNTTLAGALAACKLHIPVAHIEAGVRSFNKEMPEEHNRVLVDHCSDFLFCPTGRAMHNLRHEDLKCNSYDVGDVMYDSFLEWKDSETDILKKLKWEPKTYILATVHRAGNTDNPKRLELICNALNEIGDNNRLIVPVHPRIQRWTVFHYPPVSYLDMLSLEKNAKCIITDSGGVQKEAYWFNVPCITLRNETEWPETLERGWNVLAGYETEDILRAYKEQDNQKRYDKMIYYFGGNGRVGEKIVNILRESL